MSGQLMPECLTYPVNIWWSHKTNNLRVLSTVVIYKYICKATEEAVANIQLQILLKGELAALQPSPSNMQTASSTDFDPTL